MTLADPTTTAAVTDLVPLIAGAVIGGLVVVIALLGLSLTSVRRQRRELAAMTSNDALTGLANHRAFHERLAQEVDRARRRRDPLSVVAIDVDHFKAINDAHGHAEGDRVLQAIAGSLRAQARPYDVVARLGGEEFALVLPGVDAKEAVAVAERCRLAVAALAVHGSPLACSAGVAGFPTDDPAGTRLAELADGALQWAKRSGRGRVRRFDAREVALSGSEERQQVRALLDRSDGLVAVFQPLIELTTGRVAGYEALSRFPGGEPDRAPGDWFAQARRCGLGPALEARAIATALAVPDRPEHTFLSVNVSPAGLTSDEVMRVLPTDIDDVVVELTEDDLFASDESLEEVLADLRARGARIAVDDAGAGYAGLQQMVRIKPDILKLDRSLIRGIHRDPSKIALLEAMARFAATTGAAVCAEGVEEIDELRVLARFDVTYGQGFALARPCPPWTKADPDVAAHATAEARWGMRVLTGPRRPGEDLTVGDVSDLLSRVRSRGDLDRALAMIERLVHADDIAVSVVIPGERCVQTISSHERDVAGGRYSFDDYPTTEQVVLRQTLGQLVAGDAAADPAELALLRHDDMSALLLAPIVLQGETVGLLEVYRRAARPWSGTEVDQVRGLALQLSAVLAAPGVVPGELRDVIVGGPASPSGAPPVRLLREARRAPRSG